jgi:hypothetical protein
MIVEVNTICESYAEIGITILAGIVRFAVSFALNLGMGQGDTRLVYRNQVGDSVESAWGTFCTAQMGQRSDIHGDQAP